MPGKVKKAFSQLIVRYPEIGVLIVLGLIVAVFTFFSDNFLNLSSLTSMFTVAAEVGIVAIGVSMLMISGEFDISVGSVMCIATLIFCYLANNVVTAPVALVITLAACAIIGLITGLITLRLKIPSFITSLGMMMLWRGMHNYLTDGFVVQYADEALQRDQGFLNILGGNPIDALPMFHMTCVWFVVLMLIFFFVLTKTKYGNHVFATGGNQEAARNAGVKVNKVKLINFVICAALAGFAGAANLARYKTSQGQLGVGLELEAIAACVIGGNLLMGGAGTIIGTFIGAVLMSIIRTGLIILGISSYLYLPITGVIIILAVVLNTFIRKLRA